MTIRFIGLPLRDMRRRRAHLVLEAKDTSFSGSELHRGAE